MQDAVHTVKVFAAFDEGQVGGMRRGEAYGTCHHVGVAWLLLINNFFIKDSTGFLQVDLRGPQNVKASLQS